MRLYKCNNCGGVFERDEIDWRAEKYDEVALNGLLYAFCPECGSDDIEFGQSCEWCEADLADEWLGQFHVCVKCYQMILSDVEKTISDFAHNRSMDYSSAKEWFIGWAEKNW